MDGRVNREELISIALKCFLEARSRNSSKIWYNQASENCTVNSLRDRSSLSIEFQDVN
ncbi:hypothetical protein [Tychonema sp. LEGE 06208]|uniref:hypothetical protein n=1 Tax=Tychonema sp. LEGE 06208 TaxID=1828663 RepID=UPI00187FB71C|nr:hypothetical protein [Tychonema sp. LEGE 06208]MBE9165813.1 hypothetical protein [Tychonema sp. LEGE 06208]